MLFGNEALDGRLMSAIRLTWEQTDLLSGDRPFHALSYRKSGGAKLISDTGTTEAAVGDILLVPAHCPYRLISSGPEEVYVAHFVTQKALPPEILKFTPKNPTYYGAKFEDMCNSWSRKQVGFEYESRSIFERILFRIEQEESRLLTGDTLQEIMEFLGDHFGDRELDLAKLAQKYGMSPAYFRRRFGERYGISPKRYVQSLRLGLARDLLATGYYSVEQVADMCGFANVYYFSNFVKKETGLSPSNLFK